MFRRLLLIFVLMGGLLAVLLLSQTRKPPKKVSGFIEADEIRLGSRVGGRVAKVYVREGQRVSAGEVLLELEPFDLQARRIEAEALLAEREAALARLTAGLRPDEIGQAKARVQRLEAVLSELEHGPRPQEIETAKAQLAAASALVDLAESSYERTREVFAGNASTRQELDQAMERLRAARAEKLVRELQLEQLLAGTRSEQLDQARANLDEARHSLALAEQGFRKEEIAQATAARDAAKGTLQAVDAQLGELTIRAPIDGIIESLDLQTGDLVAPNAPGVSMLDTKHLWIRAYVPLNLVSLTVGSKVKVTVDGIPNERLDVTITYIAKQAEFSPNNVQTFDERATQVYRVHAELPAFPNLWPGMAADLWLDPIGAP
jgi:HlyD family secretion protein